MSQGNVEELSKWIIEEFAHFCRFFSTSKIFILIFISGFLSHSSLLSLSLLWYLFFVCWICECEDRHESNFIMHTLFNFFHSYIYLAYPRLLPTVWLPHSNPRRLLLRRWHIRSSVRSVIDSNIRCLFPCLFVPFFRLLE